MGKYTSYTILPEFRVILCNLQGRVILNDLIELNIKFISDPLYDSLYNVILDFRDSLTIGYRIDVAEYVSFFRKSVKLKQTVKVGILYNTPNQEFLFTVYKTFGKLIKLDIEIFKELNSCLHWIGFGEEDQKTMENHLLAIKKKANFEA